MTSNTQNKNVSRSLKVFLNESSFVLIVTILFFIRGRVYLEGYYKGLGLPLRLVEWNWNSTILVGGFISMKEITWIILLCAIYIFMRSVVGNDLTKFKIKIPRLVEKTYKIILGVSPLIFVFYLVYQLNQAGSEAKEKAEKYIKNPIIVQYSLKNYDSKKLKKAKLLHYFASSQTSYLIPEEDHKILKYQSGDFLEYQIIDDKKLNKP